MDTLPPTLDTTTVLQDALADMWRCSWHRVLCSRRRRAHDGLNSPEEQTGEEG